MAKPSTLEDLTFYDWSVSRWVTSDAHDELDALGRGIYREMLDYCYVQGSVSADPVVLSRRCACTRQELIERWETIERYFYRSEDGKLRNRHADAFRSEYTDFIEVRRANGRRGGRPKKPIENQPLSENKPSGLSPLNQPQNQPGKLRREDKRKKEEEETTQHDGAVAAAFDGWFDFYPKAVRRDAARGAWFQLMESGDISLKTISDVIAGTERWKNSKEWAKEDGEYIPEPKTFLIGNLKHSGRLWKEYPKQKHTDEPATPERVWTQVEIEAKDRETDEMMRKLAAADKKALADAEEERKRRVAESAEQWKRFEEAKKKA